MQQAHHCPVPPSPLCRAVYAENNANTVPPFSSTFPCAEGYTWYRTGATLPAGCLPPSR
jgi:hypothetical protein